jgi:enoyl-CoA hydratase
MKRDGRTISSHWALCPDSGEPIIREVVFGEIVSRRVEASPLTDDEPQGLVSELERCVERADLDPAVHVILLAGNGKGFCGGYDLVESAEGQGRMGGEELLSPPGSPLDPMVMAANHDPAGTWDPMVDYGMMSRNARAFMSLFHCSKPAVCKVHGFCIAGGTDMALCSDLLVIAADAKIGYPPARVWGSPTTSMWAYRLGSQRAKRLLFTVSWGSMMKTAGSSSQMPSS